MGPLGFLAVLASGCISTAYAAGSSGISSNTGTSVEGVIHFPLTRRVRDSGALPAKVTRPNGTAPVSILQDMEDETVFVTYLTVGSDEQQVLVQIDTGTSDLWLMDPNNPYCSMISNGTDVIFNTSPIYDDYTILCETWTFFDKKNSTTFTKNETSFSTTMGPTFANGTYAQDTVRIGNVSIPNANFALATSANISVSTLGIGLMAGEASVNSVSSFGAYSPTYANLPAQLKEQGVIKANAYSLWLNDVYIQEGSLLFGGIDHAKYQGSLTKVPMVSEFKGISEPSHPRVMLHGINLYQGNQSAQVVECSLPATLSTLSQFMLLPDEITLALVESIGAVYSNQEYFVAPCDLDGGLTMDLSGITVDVPFSELIFDTGLDDLCALGIKPGGNQLVLGETFLRSTYAVFDLDNKEVAFGVPVYNVSSSSIEAISEGIPRATEAPNYSSTQVLNRVNTTLATFFKDWLSDYVSDQLADGYFTASSVNISDHFTGLSTSSMPISGSARPGGSTTLSSASTAPSSSSRGTSTTKAPQSTAASASGGAAVETNSRAGEHSALRSESAASSPVSASTTEGKPSASKKAKNRAPKVHSKCVPLMLLAALAAPFLIYF